MLKCNRCKSNEVKVKLIDNNTNIRIKKYICKICSYEETEEIFIQQKRNQGVKKQFSFFDLNGTEFK